MLAFYYFEDGKKDFYKKITYLPESGKAWMQIQGSFEMPDLSAPAGLIREEALEYFKRATGENFV